MAERVALYGGELEVNTDDGHSGPADHGISRVGAGEVHVAAALAANGFVPDDLRTHHPSLEDAFLAYTGRSLVREVG